MLPAGAKIGILGGGQLGRMLSRAAKELDFTAHIYAPEPSPCAAEIAAHHLRAPYDDHASLEKFAQQLDVITFEFENIPFETAQFLSSLKPFYPHPRALQISQDRLVEKKFFNDLGIATAPFKTCNENINKFPLPAIIKTRRLGYDGKGQIKVSTEDEIKAAIKQLAVPAIIEQSVNFVREIAIVAVRDEQGQMVFYDPIETTQQAGILHEARIPVAMDSALCDQAINITRKIAEALDYVGVLAVEMFDMGGQLLVNEMAPRVHNSGHWTQDACRTGQFAQHIRAIAGWPLGATSRSADVVMTNILGEDIHHWAQKPSTPDRVIHIYNKGEPRAGRKMGHITQLFPLSGASSSSSSSSF